MATLQLTNPRLVSGNVATGNSAVAINAGQLITLDSDYKLILADAGEATTYQCEGIALNGGEIGDKIAYATDGAIMEFDNMNNTTWGTNWWVSNEGGAAENYNDMSNGEYLFNIARTWGCTKRVKLIFVDFAVVKGTLPSSCS